MSTFKLDVQFDVKRAMRALSDLQKKQVPRAAARALNRTGEEVRTQVVRDLSKEMGKETGLSVSGFRKSIAQKKATQQRLVTELVASGRPLPLMRFGAKQRLIEVKHTKRSLVPVYEVSAKAWGKRKTYKGAFIATLRSGRKGVFIRTSKKRLPIKELYGPSIPQTFIDEKIIKGMERHAGRVWPKNFQRELNYYLSKLK